MTTTTDNKMMNPVFHDVVGVAGGNEGEVTLSHVRGTRDFRFGDVVVGRSWMAGLTTAGRVAVGCVKGVDIGEGFVIRQRGGQRSKLWREFWLLEAAPERLASSASGEPLADSDAEEGPLSLRRTDSGLDYRLPGSASACGYPDCAWWADNWMPSLFVVPTPPATPDDILRLLVSAMDCGEVPASGPFREAWDRQMESCHAARNAAPAPSCISPASPTVMARLRQTAESVAAAVLDAEDGSDTPDSLPPLLPPLRIPTVRDHIGQGIRPGDFIKPDPHDARAVQRRHILTELRTCLSDRMIGQARLASHTDMMDDEIRAAMSEGRGWPGGRLWLLLQTLETHDIPLPGRPALRRDTTERLHLAGVWAADFCDEWLRRGGSCHWDVERLALGFVTEDRLSDGRTIADLWPQDSDLDALRNAPPLPSDDEEEEVAPLLGLNRSLDASIDEINAVMGRFLTGESTLEFKVRMPGWAWTALILTVVGYFWLVAFLLSGRKG